jgi:hypothetical protein
MIVSEQYLRDLVDGVDDFLTKPIRSPELFAAIDLVMTAK